MSFIPSLARLDHTHLKWDKEWIFHKLPHDNIEIPRHHLPDPEAEAIPGTGKQESVADIERSWLDLGLDRISMDAPSSYAENNRV
ncbi:hypothetical protein KIN20_026206 [Parelaphostrongylus tenuis]|uniref:Anaphase-promoting complex subunit 13 n=1 Tax=Parelaphostrongylus tenuis TaxID=148309 RepID=A0AAD5NDN6_PARTN|nr:hypothetical protein KIN20_026206 [Parelaphostrongylus tenuis]